MDVFSHLDRVLRDLRWSLLRVDWAETLATASLLVVILTGVGVALCARFPDSEAIRSGIVILVLGVVLGSLAHAILRAIRLFRDRVGLVILLRSKYPEVGPGIETVVRLRPALDGPSPPPFSVALLAAEAIRVIEGLNRLPPKPPADIARIRGLVIATAAAVAILIGATIWRPADVATGVRRLTGLTAIPSWMVLPEEDAEWLAYDIRTAWLIARPDGSRVRVAAGEVADILAPPGVEVEVTGSLTRPIRSGKAVVVSSGRTTEVPLALASPEGFAFALPEVRDGVWFLDVVTTAGTRIREKSRRRLVPIAVEPPKVHVEPRGFVPLRSDGTVTIAYSIESRVGLARVEALVRFPFAPMRPPVRVLLTTTPGERLIRGEMSFTWPEEPTLVSGRADLEVEAYDWLARGAQDAGRSQKVRFVLDSPLPRRLAEIEEGEDLLAEMVRLLGESPSGLEEPSSREASSPRTPSRRTHPPEGGASGPTWMTVIERSRKVLAFASSRKGSSGSPVAEDVVGLESAALELDAVIRREWASFVSLRLSDLERESARWRGVPVRIDPRWVRSLQESLSRVRLVLVVLNGIEEREMLRGNPTSTHRVASYRRAEAATRARDAVTATLDLLPSGQYDRPGIEAALGRCSEAVEAVRAIYRSSFSGVERVAFGQIIVSPVVSHAIKEVIESQRVVHDRTAQVAFEWKNRADQAAASTPDSRDLLQRIGEGRRRLHRIPLARLDAGQASDVARMIEDLSAVGELVDASDYASALEQAKDLVERMSWLASEMGDEAQWMEGEPRSSVLADAARNLLSAARSLREVTRALALWKSRADTPPTPTMRAELTGIIAEQNRVIMALDKAMQPLGHPHETYLAEVVSLAMSARRNMSEASARLVEGRPAAAEVHQRQAVQDLLRLRRTLERGPMESVRREVQGGEEDGVTIPVSAPRQAASELFLEIRQYAGEPPRPGTEDLVRAYYDSLTK